jgi:putative phosphoesterase
MLVGLISDTHGLMRPEALRALAGVDLILHAGDVGARDVLDALRGIAPVYAVRGNVDHGDGELRSTLDLQLEGTRVHVSHGHELGSPTPEALAARYGADVIVYGHTHRALVKQVGPALVVNPGAAGAARFKLQPSVALLTLPAREAKIVFLQDHVMPSNGRR